MSNININLSANTAQYTERLKKAKTDTDRNLIKMEQRFDAFANGVSQDFTSVNGAVDAMMNGVKNIKFGGYIAGAGAMAFGTMSVVSSMIEMAQRAAEANIELQALAQHTGMSTSELAKMEGVLGSIGINIDKFGDWGKDLKDKLGDYLTAGTGAFQDFFDVIKNGSKMVAADLAGMNTIDAYKAIVAEMEKAGASQEQMVWVMEGIGDEAARLLPLLKNNGAEYDRLSEKMNRTHAVLSKNTSESVQSLDASMKSLSNNFEVYMTEKFKGLMTWMDKLAHKASNMFSQSADMQKAINAKDAVLSGDLSYKQFNDVDSLSQYIESLKTARSEKMKLYEADKQRYALNSKFASSVDIEKQKQIKAEADLLALEEKRARVKLDTLEKSQGPKFGTVNIEGDGQEAKIRQEQIKLDNATTIWQKANDERAKYLATAQKMEEDAAKARALGDAREAKRLEDLAVLQRKYASQNEDRAKIENANMVAAQKSLIDAKRELGAQSMQVAIDYADSEAAEKKAKRDKDAYDAETAMRKGEMSKEKYNQYIARLDADLADELDKINKAKVDDTAKAEDARLKAALFAATTGTERLKAQYDIDLANLRKQLNDKNISQAQYNAKAQKMETEHLSAIKLAELNASIEKLNTAQTFATTDKEQKQAQRDAELLSLQQHLVGKENSEDLYRNKKAELERKWAEEDVEATHSKYMQAETMQLINAQNSLNTLNEQRAAELVTEEEYAKQKILLEKQVTDAKQAFAVAQLNTTANLLGQAAQSMEEGSSQQKAALAMQKAATIASMTVNQWQAWSDIDGPASPYKDPLSKNIAKASVIAQYVAGIGSVAATAIGQFHSGTDEVDKTGSYILKEGERVVQPSANKDLTAYLQANKDNAANGISISAPLTIQGDANIDENKFKAMLVQHRESLVAAVKLAQRENPAYR